MCKNVHDREKLGIFMTIMHRHPNYFKDSSISLLNNLINTSKKPDDNILGISKVLAMQHIFFSGIFKYRNYLSIVSILESLIVLNPIDNKLLSCIQNCIFIASGNRIVTYTNYKTVLDLVKDYQTVPTIGESTIK